MPAGCKRNENVYMPHSVIRLPDIFLSLLFIVCGLRLTACTGPVLNPLTSPDGRLISDLTPAQGKGTAPPGATGIGPWATRLMLATSDDGLTFTRTHEILADQCGVPNIIIDNDGRLRVYYIDFGNGNILAAAIRDFDGEWAYRRISINGAAREGDPADPSVVLLPDNRYRIYYTQGTYGPYGPYAKVYSALSLDGLRFTAERGARFSPGPPVFDPIVLKTAEIWKLWTGPDGQYTAFSSDGLTFQAGNAFQVDGRVFMVWAALKLPTGGYRLYGHYPDTNDGICSVFSSDGALWSSEPGTRLSNTGGKSRLESIVLPDVGVTVLQDSTYVMAYLAVIP